MIFTRAEIVKRARKLGRINQKELGIDKMSEREFRSFSQELDRLASQFFNISKQQDNPEKSFIDYVKAGHLVSELNEQPERTRLACALLNSAATTIVREKIQQLNEALEA